MQSSCNPEVVCSVCDGSSMGMGYGIEVVILGHSLQMSRFQVHQLLSCMSYAYTQNLTFSTNKDCFLGSHSKDRTQWSQIFQPLMTGHGEMTTTSFQKIIAPKSNTAARHCTHYELSTRKVLGDEVANTMERDTRTEAWHTVFKPAILGVFLQYIFRANPVAADWERWTLSYNSTCSFSSQHVNR